MLDEVVLPGQLTLRESQTGDETFMEHLFGSTRQYLHLIDMPEPAIELLIKHQYQLQQTSYAHQAPDARSFLILLSKKAVGKIILDRNRSSVHIIDLALIPEQRGNGIGTAVLRAIQAMAVKTRLPVLLSVDKQNVLAKKLYLSLGFRVTEASDTHEEMIWTPENLDPKTHS